MTPTKLKLPEIEARCNAATPGHRVTVAAQIGNVKFNYLVLADRKERHTNWFPTKEDLEFMNKSLGYIPLLIECVKYLSEVIKGECYCDHGKDGGSRCRFCKDLMDWRLE